MPERYTTPAEQDAAGAGFPPVCLYRGKVMHARIKPKPHRFTYSVFSMLIDLDRLEDADQTSSMFSVNTGNLASFHEADHGPRDGSSLRLHIEKLLADGGLERPARVLLWCNPRILGYTFNPLSIYYCFDESHQLSAIVYQVHNTFGEAHAYVAPVDASRETSGAIRQSADKRFYVSPFLDMDLRYDFRLNTPGEDLRVRILEHDAEGPVLAATFSGTKLPMNNRNLLLGITKCLGLTWKITAGIHYEALFLWLKGIGIRSRPSPPVKASYVVNGKNIVAGE